MQWKISMCTKYFRFSTVLYRKWELNILDILDTLTIVLKIISITE